MKISFSIVAAAIFVGVSIQPASAFALGPFAPSQVVQLKATTGSPPCPGFVSGTSFDTVLLPDGSAGPFVIPPGQVLVVTRVEMLGFGVSAGTLIQSRVWRGGAGGTEIAAIRESSANDSGRINHAYEFSPGLVVANGGTVCVNGNAPGLTFTGYLQGYLKRDL